MAPRVLRAAVAGRAAPSPSTDCSSQTWHLGWWRLASGLSGGEKGRTYRVHTYSTEKSNPAAQNNTTAMNAFAIWSRATGGSPKVYGIGSMETLVRLPPSTTSEFYLARIDRVHAGKTLQIELWDPALRAAGVAAIFGPGTAIGEVADFLRANVRDRSA